MSCSSLFTKCSWMKLAQTHQRFETGNIHLIPQSHTSSCYCHLILITSTKEEILDGLPKQKHIFPFGHITVALAHVQRPTSRVLHVWFRVESLSHFSAFKSQICQRRREKRLKRRICNCVSMQDFSPLQWHYIK